MNVITVMVRNGGTGEIHIHPSEGPEGRRAVIVQQDLLPKKHIGWLVPLDEGKCAIRGQNLSAFAVYPSWEAAALTLYVAFAFSPIA